MNWQECSQLDSIPKSHNADVKEPAKIIVKFKTSPWVSLIVMGKDTGVLSPSTMKQWCLTLTAFNDLVSQPPPLRSSCAHYGFCMAVLMLGCFWDQQTTVMSFFSLIIKGILSHIYPGKEEFVSTIHRFQLISNLIQPFLLQFATQITSCCLPSFIPPTSVHWLVYWPKWKTAGVRPAQNTREVVRLGAGNGEDISTRWDLELSTESRVVAYLHLAVLLTSHSDQRRSRWIVTETWRSFRLSVTVYVAL